MPALDLTKHGEQLVFDLLNAANPNQKHGPFATTNVTLGAPTPLSGHVSGNNSSLVVTGTVGAGYSGARTITYSRLDLTAVLLAKGVTGTLSFPNSSYKTSTDLLPLINTTYNMNLQPTDVVQENLPADDDVTGVVSYTLKASANCLTYTGQLGIALQPASIDLGRAFKGNILNGFVPPDTSRVNLATALTGNRLTLFTLDQLKGNAS